MSKVALITGAATGIGKDSAIRLAEDGFNLILADWNRTAGEETAQLCREKGVSVDFIYADMGIEADVEKIVALIHEKYDHLDFYLNNQGVINDPKLIQNITEEEVDDLLHTNVKGCFFGLKHIGRYLLDQMAGHIVIVSSSSGVRSETGFGFYSATKHAVIGLAKDAAIEFASKNVRVNVICPGGIVTPLTEKVGKYMMEQQFVQPKPSIGLLNGGAMGDVSQISGVVSFMASDASSFMTGAVLNVDGGNTL